MFDHPTEWNHERRRDIWLIDRVIISVAFTTALVFGPLVIATGFLTDQPAEEGPRLASFELRPAIDDDWAPLPAPSLLRGR